MLMENIRLALAMAQSGQEESFDPVNKGLVNDCRELLSGRSRLAWTPPQFAVVASCGHLGI